MAAPTRFEMEKNRPMMGTLSRKAAAKPKAVTSVAILPRTASSGIIIVAGDFGPQPSLHKANTTMQNHIPLYAHLRSSTHRHTSAGCILLVSKYGWCRYSAVVIARRNEVTMGTMSGSDGERGISRSDRSVLRLYPSIPDE